MVVVFRFLGWIWMTLLVVVTLIFNPPPRLWIVYAALILASLWTLLTWYMARQRPEAFAGPVWFTLDSLVMLAIGAASIASGADELFHGGMPLSYVFVGALWAGLPGSLIAAILLAIEQFAVHVVAGFGPVRAAGSIIFFIIAAIVGWTFDRLRDYDIARQRAEGQLAAEREAVAAHEARVELVNKLHDSVLQTLALIQRSDDPARMAILARHQEAELRDWLYGNAPLDGIDLLSTALKQAAARVETDFQIPVDVVTVGDHPVDERARAVIGAASEAMVNAAKHSGADRMSLYMEVEQDRLEVFITDQGKGFDPENIPADRKGLSESIRARVERVGGSVTVDSEPGEGTEVMLELAF